MSGKSLVFSGQLLALIFNGTAIAGLAQNNATTPYTQLYLSLHTADPGTSGAQNVNEAAYGGYARVAVNRNSAGFVITGNQLALTTMVSFAAATSGSETETYWGVGTAISGAGLLLYSGPISPTIAVTTGVTPALSSASTITEG